MVVTAWGMLCRALKDAMSLAEKEKMVCVAGGRVVASPYARKLAREAGVDVANAMGSGPGG